MGVGVERGIRAFSGAPRPDVNNIGLYQRVVYFRKFVRHSVLLSPNGSPPRIPHHLQGISKKRRAKTRLSFWRRRRDSNPRGLSPKRFSRPPRYDRFDTPAYNCCKDGRAITIPSILLYEFKNEKSNVFTGEGEEVSKRRRSSFCELRRDTFTTKKLSPRSGRAVD